MRKTIFNIILFLIAILITNISMASYSTVQMEVIEEPVCTIQFGDNSSFEKRLIEKNLNNKEVTIQLQVVNNEGSLKPTGELMLVLDNSNSMNETVDDNEEIKSFEDLDGKTTANTLASTYSLLAESYGAKATGVDSLADTILLVEQGRVDATLNANVSFFDYMKVHPDSPLKIVAETDTPSKVSIPVRKGEPEFLEAINEAIDELRENGELEEISIKYFGSDVTE